jgi:hypothetical protein
MDMAEQARENEWAREPDALRDLGVLAREDCMRLLDSITVGRIVFTARALPAIAPVNYAVVDGEIVVRTGAGSKLDAAVANSVVAFEADQLDVDRREGWSVVVVGQARVVTDPEHIALLDELNLQCWLVGDRSNYVAIRPQLVSGRVLVPAGLVPADPPVDEQR